MRRLIAAIFLAAAACASPGIPPGGPQDREAPTLLGVSPDSGKTGISPPAVVFRFDEVVAERPPSVTSLEQLFIISPRDGTPSVDWKRKDVTVRPSKGWRANITYVVTLLPGMADLRGNVRNTGAQTFFSTGRTVSTREIRGNVWDWVTEMPAQRAYVEAIRLPDSVTFIAIADSTGGFRVRYLPDGQFLVRAVVDDNRNRGLDPREAWDSATVSSADTANISLFVIARDSVVPLLGNVTAVDSVTLRLTFERALNPQALPAADEIAVKAADSSRIQVVSVGVPPRDSTIKAKTSPKPAPPRVLIIRLATPLRVNADYRVTISRVTGMKISGPAVRVFKTPPPAGSPATAPPPPVKR